MKRLSSRVVPVRGLDEAARRRLFDIHSRHHEDVSEERFRADLEEQDFAILLDADGAVQGFSTQQVLRVSVGPRPLRAVYSGETVIDRAFWGEQELVRAWCRFVGRVWSEDPRTPLHWFLASRGYRSYLYLPLFFRDYYPRPEGETPPFQRALCDALAQRKHPGLYNAQRGVVETRDPVDRLRGDLAQTPRGRRDDPRVAFYARRNPGYARGEKLVSVAEISGVNMKGLARRMFDEGARLGPIRLEPVLL